MVDILTSVKFPQEPFEQFVFDKESVIQPLSKVNLFIGQNNSGKSRLLRNMFSMEDYQFTSKQISSNEFNAFIDSLINELKQFYINNITAISDISLSSFQSLKIQDSFFSNTLENYRDLKKLLGRLSNAGGGITTDGGYPPLDISYYEKSVRAVGANYLKKIESLNFESDIISSKRIYIPIIRGMRPFDTQPPNFYKARTIRDYFQGKINDDDKRLIIFTGIELYDTLRSKLLGEPEDREVIGEYEKYLSKNFFKSEKVTLIPRDGSDLVAIKIGNENQLLMHQLGDGLQNLIIITFNSFIRKDNTLFFIEEPDLGMHPGMQRQLIECMYDNPLHQYFLTTHSNHLLDLTLDFNKISVFNFKKVEKGNSFSFEVKSTSSEYQTLLHELGVRNSSVFLANTTIWVEGITDRLYLRQYLKKYVYDLAKNNDDKAALYKSFKEDIDYSFVEYQGSNLPHWTFIDDGNPEKIKAQFLCGKPILIADGDIAKKTERVKYFSEILKEKYIQLECKEIENLIPEEILRKIAKEKFNEHKKEISLISFKNYSKLDYGLGQYLDELLGVKNSKSIFKALEGSSVKNKLPFCNRALAEMEDLDSWLLPTKLKDLCQSVCGHVEQNR